MVVAGSEERAELDQTIQDDKKGMLVTREVIEAPLEEKSVEMNLITIVKNQKKS